jgi:hypothetical protein
MESASSYGLPVVVRSTDEQQPAAQTAPPKRVKMEDRRTPCNWSERRFATAGGRSDDPAGKLAVHC